MLLIYVTLMSSNLSGHKIYDSLVQVLCSLHYMTSALSISGPLHQHLGVNDSLDNKNRGRTPTIKVEVLWIVTPYSVVIGYHPEDRAGMVLRNVGILQHYSSQPRRPRLQSSPP